VSHFWCIALTTSSVLAGEPTVTFSTADPVRSKIVYKFFFENSIYKNPSAFSYIQGYIEQEARNLAAVSRDTRPPHEKWSRAIVVLDI
jgi:hypothetical protein